MSLSWSTLKDTFLKETQTDTMDGALCHSGLLHGTTLVFHAPESMKEQSTFNNAFHLSQFLFFFFLMHHLS